jgi:hypothetical protein
VEYTGATATGLKAGNSYNNLTFSGSGTYTLNNDLTIAGVMTVGASETVDLVSNSLLGPGTVANSGLMKLVGDNTTMKSITGGTVEYTGATATGLKAGNSYNNLTFSGIGAYTLNSGLTVSGFLTNGAFSLLDLNGQILHVAGALTNNGTLRLIGSESPTLGSFTDTGTVQYYGNGPHTITSLGTYNNLQFSNGTFTGSSLSAKNNIIIDGNATLDLANDSTLTADSDASGAGAFLMDAAATITGNGHNLALNASGSSTLGGISNIGNLTLNAQKDTVNFEVRNSMQMNGDLGVNTGVTLTGNSNVTVNGGDVTGDGIINMSAGTFQVTGTGNFGGNYDWTFGTLQFGDGVIAGTTTKIGVNKITALGGRTVSSPHTLVGFDQPPVPEPATPPYAGAEILSDPSRTAQTPTATELYEMTTTGGNLMSPGEQETTPKIDIESALPKENASVEAFVTTGVQVSETTNTQASETPKAQTSETTKDQTSETTKDQTSETTGQAPAGEKEHAGDKMPGHDFFSKFFNPDRAVNVTTDVKVREGAVYTINEVNEMSLLTQGESMKVNFKEKKAELERPGPKAAELESVPVAPEFVTVTASAKTALIPPESATATRASADTTPSASGTSSTPATGTATTPGSEAEKTNPANILNNMNFGELDQFKRKELEAKLPVPAPVVVTGDNPVETSAGAIATPGSEAGKINTTNVLNNTGFEGLDQFKRKEQEAKLVQSVPEPVIVTGSNHASNGGALLFGQPKPAVPVVMGHDAVAGVYATLKNPGNDVFVKCKGRDWQPANDGMVVLPGDVVKTAAAGSVEVMLEGGKVGRIEIKEGSLFRISKAEKNLVTGDKTTLLELAIGKLIAHVEKLQGKSRFEVKTPTALTGVRGTVFEVVVKEKL